MAQLNEHLQFKTEASEGDKKNEAEIASELTDLKNEVTGRLAYISDAFRRIVSDTEGVKSNANSFHVGKESVQPLVELKTASCEIFNNVKNNDPTLFNQEIDFDPLIKHVNEMKRQNRETRQFINYLQLTIDGITKLTEIQRKQKTNENSSESCSSLSIESSVSGFSPFENRDINVITSSPLPSAKNYEQQED